MTTDRKVWLLTQAQYDGALAALCEGLEDGTTADIGADLRVVLHLEHDPDTSISDYDGYGKTENLEMKDIIREKYRGIRPAPGYPACPDHTEKPPLFDLLNATALTGITLTDSAGNTMPSPIVTDVLGCRSAIYILRNPTTSATHTFNVAGAAIYASIQVEAYAGATAASPPDQTGAGTSDSGATSLATSSVTPSEDNEIVLALTAAGIVVVKRQDKIGRAHV